jgi:SAM-dependent methyltransferase
MGDTRKIVREGYDLAADAYLAARPADGGDVALLRALITRLRSGDAVLDAGCGAGVPVMRHLAEAGLATVGLDFSPAQLALACENVPGAPLVRGDLAALPYAERSFAAAVSFYAVIHVPRADHRAVFGEIRRVLRPGGLALLCLGANDLPEDHDRESWLGEPMFWSHFDAETNLRLLSSAGFEVLHDEIVPDPMGHGAHLFALVRRA